jgi:peptidoglycan/LPS O-acetylase OafA/YrhL
MNSTWVLETVRREDGVRQALGQTASVQPERSHRRAHAAPNPKSSANATGWHGDDCDDTAYHTSVRKHLASLDGLRGVAALAVVAKHFQNLSRINLHFQQASVAVDLFFILSGFVIARAYEPRLADGLSWRGYMGLRLARLYPAIAAALVISGCIWLLAGGPAWPQLLLQFALLPVVIGPAIYAGDLFPLDGPQWSLFWELVVNGLHAAVFRWLTPTRIMVIMGLALIGLVLAAQRWGWLDVGWTRRSMWCAFPRAVWGFCAGLLIYKFDQRGWRAPRVPYAVLVGVLILCMIRWIPTWRLFWAGDLALVVVILPAIVAFAVQAKVPQSWVGPATWLGAISYPLYTLHVPLLRGFRWWLLDNDPLPIWQRAVLWWIVLALVIAAAAMFERFYDAPIRAWLARKRAVRRAAGTPQADRRMEPARAAGAAPAGELQRSQAQ